MTRKTAWILAIVLTLILLVAVVLVGISAPEANARFRDAAAALTFIGAAALGIERAIEAIWTFLGGAVGSYWPLNVVNRQIDGMVEELDEVVEPFHNNVLEGLRALNEKGLISAEQLDKAKKDIAGFAERFEGIKKLAPGNQRIKLLTSSASQHVHYLAGRYAQHLPEITFGVQTAESTIANLQGFLANCKDNPGRRLISLYLGAVIGLVVAGIFGLDIFAAVLESTAVPQAMRVCGTGLIIGLGSSPTHEVIRVLQEVKKRQKG